MKTEYPRDVDPSITGQPHQATGEAPGLMGTYSRTLGNPVDVPAAAPFGAAAFSLERARTASSQPQYLSPLRPASA